MPPQARFRIRRRYVHFHALLPFARIAGVAVIAGTLVVGVWQWFAHSNNVVALEFTPRIIGIETGAVGVRDIKTGDIDNDGDLDVVTAGQDGINIYENRDNFSFTKHLIGDQDTERVVIARVDNDDKKDLVITYHGNSPSVRWLRNTGDLNFSANNISTAGADGVAGVGDINGDGAQDIVTGSSVGGNIVLERWMNDGSGNFTATTLNSNSAVSAIAIGGVTDNGYNDIITSGTAGLQRWNFNGSTYTRVDIDDSNPNRTHLAIADTNDGRTFIFTADHITDTIAVYRSSGLGRTLIKTAIDGKTVTPADLNGDGDLDLLVASQDDNSVYYYDNNGSDVFSQSTLASGLRSVYGVAVGDLDGDGDLDVVTADPVGGTIYAYERVRAKPKATAPSDIKQSSSGNGVVTFVTTISDGDSDATSARIQYSVDGDHWYKPWLTKAVVSSGEVDLNNGVTYQVGSSNAIDTDTSDSVELTLTWDTKSSKNTGAPIVGDVGNVWLRVIPKDEAHTGDAARSAKFRVDNGAPSGAALALTSIDSTQARLSWNKPSDSSAFTYKIYYDTDHAKALEQKSAVWDEEDDAALADLDTTSTTITGLSSGQRYTFKLFITDALGNVAGVPSVQGVARQTEQASEPAVVLPSPSSADIVVSPPPDEIIAAPSLTRAATPTPSPFEPPTLIGNAAPQADAGLDLAVNPNALVILDASASYDPDPGQTAQLIYNWRQLSGPDVDLKSDRTVNPNFSAGDQGDVYIFALTIRDLKGASAIDTVTVATKELPVVAPVPVEVGQITPTQQPEQTTALARSPLVRNILLPADLLLFILASLATGLLLFERIHRVVRDATRKKPRVDRNLKSQGRVVHFLTGEPIAGAQVLIYGSDGKIRAREQTNDFGVFPTFFPQGTYKITVQAKGFSFAPAIAGLLAGATGLVYSGGNLTVKDPNTPLAIVIPMKPVAAMESSFSLRLLHVWQFLEQTGRVLSWPLFLAGAILNTVLVFIAPSILFLIIEALYVVLVIIKIALELRVRPAYGQVRDAITHIPLDLAVVRLFQQSNNRLIMTRVTNAQGKFFALPPAGIYRVTIAKPGYAMFSTDNIAIKSEHDTTMQMIADLMPVAPKPMGSLALARAATV